MFHSSFFSFNSFFICLLDVLFIIQYFKPGERSVLREKRQGKGMIFLAGFYGASVSKMREALVGFGSLLLSRSTYRGFNLELFLLSFIYDH